MATKQDQIVDEFKTSGLNCMITLDPTFFHYCGYVELPEHHPLHGIVATNDRFCGFNVHGGVTWSGEFEGMEGRWFVGFDTNHYCDAPDIEAGIAKYGREAYEKNKEYIDGAFLLDVSMPLSERIHWNEQMARNEVRSLADQLATYKEA